MSPLIKMRIEMGGKGAVIDSPVRSDDNLCTLSLPLSDVTARKRDIVRMRGEKASTCACVCTVVCVKQGEQKTISSERRKNSFYLRLELPPRFPLTPPPPFRLSRVSNLPLAKRFLIVHVLQNR